MPNEALNEPASASKKEDPALPAAEPIREQPEIVEQRAKALSFADRVLSVTASMAPLGHILHDPGDLADSSIVIDYYTSKERKHKPVAFIKMRNGPFARHEAIDILESVRSDAAAIGHPAILFALDHWQYVVRNSSYSEIETFDEQSEEGKLFKNTIIGEFSQLARHNLVQLSKALLEGPRRAVLTKEAALSIRVGEIRANIDNTYLMVAWHRLDKKLVDNTKELDGRVADIKSFLESLPVATYGTKLDLFPIEVQEFGLMDNSYIQLDDVVDFLSSAGSQFVFDENTETSLRPSRAAFQNAFIDWYFVKSRSTVAEYLRKARHSETNTPTLPTTGGLLPRTQFFGLLQDVYSRKLVYVCDPFECLETDGDESLENPECSTQRS